MTNDKMDKIISLAKRRGFIFPGSEIYGGLSNSYDYGPLGVELKNNIKKLWWERYVHRRNDIVGIDAALIMNPRVWEASGHLTEFADPLVECKKCHNRFRADELEAEVCPNCGGELTEPKKFNLMFKTFLGPAEEKANIVYFRPETAQAMFVNFKNILDTVRKTVPFGIAQIGKAFRNEITPGNYIFRTREFEQMEIEYFIREADWEKYFEYWRREMTEWIKSLGIDTAKIREAEIGEGERAHYSKRTIDFEYEFPFGRKELYGLAYRGDFDLKNHEKHSGVNLKYKDPETGEEFWPHVIEPTWGVDRSVLAVLCDAYDESDKERIILKLKPRLAPFKAAVFPLLANKPNLVKLARDIYEDLRKSFSAGGARLPNGQGPASGWMVDWDDRGNIGKRYYSQDEIGTPYGITIDFESLTKHDVTVRDRDTTKQERVKIKKLKEFIKEHVYNEL